MTDHRNPWKCLWALMALPVFLAVLGSCSSGAEEGGPELGQATILESVQEPSDGILEIPGEESVIDEPVEDTSVNSSMFSELDGLINPLIPPLSGAVQTTTFADGETIVLGGIVTETIVDIPVAPGICAGATARLDGAIARGEIAQPVEWLGCADDAGFSDRTDSALNRLRFRRPFAIVPMMSDRFFSEQLLNDELTPYIGIGSQPAFCDVTNSFGFAVTGSQGCPVLEIVGYTTAGPVLQAWLDAVSLDAAGLSVASVVDESVSGSERSRSRALEVERIGAELVLVDSSLPAGGAATDDEIDRVARAIAVQTPDVVVVEIEGADALYPRLRDLGFQGHIVGVSIDPALLQLDPALAERFVNTWQVIPGLSVVPTSAELLADAANADVARSQIGLGFVSGYASMDFLVQAMRSVSLLGPVHVRDFINGGWTYPGVDGAICASDWPTAHLSAVPCASVVHVDELGALREVMPPTQYPLLIEEVTP